MEAIDLGLNKTEKIIAITFLALITFLVLRKYYAKKESGFKNKSTATVTTICKHPDGSPCRPGGDDYCECRTFEV